MNNAGQVWSDPIPFFKRLTPTDLLVNMYPGSVTLIPAPEANQLLVPDVVVSTYTPGTLAYPGLRVDDGQLFLGTPDVISAALTPDMTGLTATVVARAVSAATLFSSSRTLSLFAGQALKVNFNSTTATEGPVSTSTLASGGTGYAANDTFALDDDAECTGTVLTVAPITGAALTYRIDSAGTTVLPGVNTTTATSGDGTGLTINVTAVLQGNGYLDLSFIYRILTIPYPW